MVRITQLGIQIQGQHIWINRGYGGEGNLPYPGITKDTCTISDKVRGKDILLIDDLYTASVNIDEDAIQALFDNGGKVCNFLFARKDNKTNTIKTRI